MHYSLGNTKIYTSQNKTITIMIHSNLFIDDHILFCNAETIIALENLQSLIIGLSWNLLMIVNFVIT